MYSSFLLVYIEIRELINMPNCNSCREELNTNNPHNWRCDNEDCVQYHRGHQDMIGETSECHRCGDYGEWRGDVFRCRECGATWA